MQQKSTISLETIAYLRLIDVFEDPCVVLQITSSIYFETGVNDLSLLVNRMLLTESIALGAGYERGNAALRFAWEHLPHHRLGEKSPAQLQLEGHCLETHTRASTHQRQQFAC